MSLGHPFSLNFNPSLATSQLLLPTAASTSKTDGSQSLATSLTSPTVVSSAEMSAETLRFLSAGHPALPAHIGIPAARFDPTNPLGGGMPSLEQYRNLAPGLPLGFLPGFGSPEMKSPDGMPGGPLGGPQALPGYYYDPTMGGYPYGGGPLDLNGARRKNATRETTAALKAWLYEHRKNPYPTKGEKIMLAIITKMTLTQVSTWFANARRRLKKENKMTWSPRNRPGEDDEDIGAGDDLERSTSSLSNRSDILPPDGTTVIKPDGDLERKREESERNNNSSEKGTERLGGEKRPASPAQPETPTKKPKIWSIADTVASSSSTAAKEEQEETSSTSISRKPEGPFHFTFNPWQHQMNTLAGLRPPFGAPGFPAAAFSPLMSPPGQVSAFAHFRPDILRSGMHPALFAGLPGNPMFSPFGGGSTSRPDAKPSVPLSPVSSGGTGVSPKISASPSGGAGENGSK